MVGVGRLAAMRRVVHEKQQVWGRYIAYRRFGSASSQAGAWDTVHKLVGAEGLPAATRYLNEFQAFDGPAFGVVKVGGDVVEYELDLLTETVKTLYGLNLMPVVIHGGGPQMNDELKRLGVEPQYIKGSRVTDERTLEIAARTFKSLNARVVDAFVKAGLSATGLPTGIFNAKITNPALGFVGEVQSVEKGPIVDVLKGKSIPVLTSLGNDLSNPSQVLNINADVAARELAIVLSPKKVLFASAKGGWLDDNTGKIVSSIDLCNEYEGLASLNYEGRQGTLLKLNEIKEIIEAVPNTSVAITASNSMLKELFTTQGAGTIFFKGEPVKSSSMDPALCTSEFDHLSTHQYGSSSAKAVVGTIPKLGKDLSPVIDSFTMEAEDQGLGKEKQIWKQLKSAYPSLAWTWSSSDESANNVLRASQDEADGMFFSRDTGMHVAWYNVGHPLKGWNATNVTRLLPDPPSEVPQQVASSAAGATGGKRYKVGLLGARGYVGGEFMKLLVNHPGFELTVASSRALEGKDVATCFNLGKSAAKNGVNLSFKSLEPEDLLIDAESKEVDVWVLALPNGLAPKFVTALEQINPNAIQIDLGADYRFDDSWTYGLPERKGAREQLKSAKRISNPGCYATGSQVGLMPLLQPKENSAIRQKKGSVPVVFGLSGYSGAGTNPSDKNDPKCLKDNIIPYTLVNHIHERECTRHLGSQIGFSPHVAPFFQGITLTISGHLEPNADGSYPDNKAVYEAFVDYYKDEPLIKVSEVAPTVRDVMGKHHVAVGGFTVDPRTGRVVIVSTIDNLLKGAATQALQNLNLALGIDEYTGII